MKAFVFTVEALLALVAAAGLLAFAPQQGEPLRLHEYKLCQDAAQIAVKNYQGEVAAFWREGREPSFLAGLASLAGANGFEAEIGNRKTGGCEGPRVSAKRAVFDEGEFAWFSLSLCYPTR